MKKHAQLDAFGKRLITELRDEASPRFLRLLQDEKIKAYRYEIAYLV